MAKLPLTPIGGSKDNFEAHIGPSIPARHAEMVRVLVKNPNEILATLTPQKAALLHAAMGICTEAGELLDMVKKHVIYNQPLKATFADGDGSAQEELGDLEFYMKDFRNILHMERDFTLLGNLTKLEKRYKHFAYSDAQAKERKDKTEPLSNITVKCALCFIPFGAADIIDVIENLKLHQACAEVVRRDPGAFGSTLKKNFPHLSGETGNQNT